MMHPEIMREYAATLRRAAELEEKLMDGLLTEDDAFATAMVGRAERIEGLLGGALNG